MCQEYALQRFILDIQRLGRTILPKEFHFVSAVEDRIPSHQLMWNPGIVFREESFREVRVNVITAHTPCISRVRYGNGETSKEELIKVCGGILRKRFMEVMDEVMNLAEQKGTDIFITEPFGCGVFGNHIRYILEVHREEVYHSIRLM